MAYYDVAQMHDTVSLQNRITACAATEGEKTPYDWMLANIWEVVAAPAWDEAWAYAIASGKTPEEAGKDAGVITDGQILTQVQLVRQEQMPKME